jgi:hypothetical protein
LRGGDVRQPRAPTRARHSSASQNPGGTPLAQGMHSLTYACQDYPPIRVGGRGGTTDASPVSAS